VPLKQILASEDSIAIFVFASEDSNAKIAFSGHLRSRATEAKRERRDSNLISYSAHFVAIPDRFFSFLIHFFFDSVLFRFISFSIHFFFDSFLF